MFIRKNQRKRRRQRLPALRPRSLKKSIDHFSGDEKKPNKCRVLKALSLRNLVRQRITALAEVRRRKTAEEFFAIRQQVLRRIFTARRRTAPKRSKAYSARCSSHRVTRSGNASKKLTRNIFISRRTKPFTPCWWNFGMRGRR